jgi:hypothetical protein
VREQSEPPSTKRSSTAHLFLIGRNSRGNWVVRDQSGLRGGLFVNHAEALRFALFENGRRQQAVVMAPGILELELASTIKTAQPTTDPQVRLERKAA